MTDPTDIPRLDYSKPPLGHTIAWRTHGAREWSFKSPEGIRLPRPANGCDDLAEYTTQRLALAAAWDHYKAHNDPPGMLLWVAAMLRERWAGEVAALRPAAWAWHDRRHALADKLRDEDIRRVMDCDPGYPLPGAVAWPRCLTWTDEQVVEVERWLADSAVEMPEVLRG